MTSAEFTSYAARMVPYWRREARNYRYRAAHLDRHLTIESIPVFKRNAADADAEAGRLEDKLAEQMGVGR